MIDFIGKSAVSKKALTPAHAGKRLQNLLDPAQLLGQAQNGTICYAFDKICVVNGVPCVRQCHPHSIRPVLLDSLFKGQEVSCGEGFQALKAAPIGVPFKTRISYNFWIQRERGISK